jgi:hypothetical protein
MPTLAATPIKTLQIYGSIDSLKSELKILKSSNEVSNLKSLVQKQQQDIREIEVSKEYFVAVLSIAVTLFAVIVAAIGYISWKAFTNYVKRRILFMKREYKKEVAEIRDTFVQEKIQLKSEFDQLKNDVAQTEYQVNKAMFFIAREKAPAAALAWIMKTIVVSFKGIEPSEETLIGDLELAEKEGQKTTEFTKLTYNTFYESCLIVEKKGSADFQSRVKKLKEAMSKNYYSALKVEDE